MSADTRCSVSDRQWFIVGRWQEFEGEGRANLLRLTAIGAFYIVQLLQYYVWTTPDDTAVAFHKAATSLAVVGSLVGLIVLLCLRRRIFPASLKYLSTTADVLLVTGLARLGSGPHSPLIFVYFLIIALAALRFNLPLVWFATLASMLAYLALVGMSDPHWFDADHVVAPVEQLMILLSLALVGIVMGQVIRRVRALAEDYRRRSARVEKHVS